MRVTPKQVPDYKKVRNYADYWTFVEWAATPTPSKKIKDQREFAKLHSIHESQLSRWKAMPEYRRDLIKRVAELMGDDLADVMYSLKNKIFKEGNAAEVALYLKWATGWVEKMRLEGGEDEEVGEMLDRGNKLIEEFDKKLKDLKTK